MYWKKKDLLWNLSLIVMSGTELDITLCMLFTEIKEFHNYVKLYNFYWQDKLMQSLLFLLLWYSSCQHIYVCYRWYKTQAKERRKKTDMESKKISEIIHHFPCGLFRDLKFNCSLPTVPWRSPMSYPDGMEICKIYLSHIYIKGINYSGQVLPP